MPRLGLGLRLDAHDWDVADYQTSLWTPADITTSLWLDADDYSTITEFGGEVATWADKSGNSNNFSQGVAGKRPNYTLANIGGLPAIVFTGSSDHELNGNNPYGASTDDYVLAVVHTGDWVVVSGSAATWGSFSRNSGFRAVLAGTATALNQSVADGVSVDVLRQGIELVRRDNGTEYTFSTTRTVIRTPGDLTLMEIFGTYYTGSLGEVVVVPGDDQTTIEKLEGYLAHKWGYESSLPALHPYKGSPPTE